MGADERLTALKKAYADIILNTSKEAAARIMVSERKALRFQHELQVVKEDALRTLLRMKQMMDSKINEVESTRLSQQRKIEELEAQLHEAEDIVSDLRGELREAHAALERVKINQQNAHREPKENMVFCASELQNGHVAVPDIVKNMNLIQINEGYKSCSRTVNHTGNTYFSHPDLPSIILRSKEPELYRNGCTQRIRACEGNTLAKEFSLSGEKTRRNDENKEVCAIPAEKEAVMEEDRLVIFSSFNKKRKRAKRYGKGRALDGNLPLTPPPSLVKTDDEGQPNNNNPDCDEKKEESMVLSKSSYRKRKMAKRNRKYGADLNRNLPDHSSEMTPLSSSPERDDSKPELVESHGVEKQVSDYKGLAEVVGPALQETGSTGSSGITVHDKSGLKVCDAAKDENRTFKYTFQRKRKRVPPSSREVDDFTHNVSAQNCTVVKNEEEKQQSVVLVDQRPKLSAESSRDSRRMAQVARQLISLSEKKWWH
ncbi:unnamed protein product [Cuscuta epithymum]|uniref:Shugoshin C-terminal domain-containing protein n=1 Tax=Cuscuta epithymum TaxID=186058 RepID=A0AAV0FYN3_9ASTE|nr:unnamed protein product [Cuscuta epithymum]